MNQWLMIDEVTCFEKGLRIEAASKVPQSLYSTEPLLIEMMAQTGGLLLGAESDYQQDIVFTKVEEAQFEPPFEPGAPVTIRVWSDQIKPEGGWFNGEILCGERILAQSKFMLMNVGELQPDGQGPVTFNETYLKKFRIREMMQK